MAISLYGFLADLAQHYAEHELADLRAVYPPECAHHSASILTNPSAMHLKTAASAGISVVSYLSTQSESRLLREILRCCARGIEF